MSEQKIIRMANQIAAFYHSKPQDAGVAGIAEHINKFWEKRMRAEFFTLLQDKKDEFDPWVVEASATIKRPD